MHDDGDVWQQQAEDQEAFESEHSGRELMDAQDALQAAREVNGQCPKCGGEMETWHTDYMGIETFIRDCMECDFQGAPE